MTKKGCFLKVLCIALFFVVGPLQAASSSYSPIKVPGSVTVNVDDAKQLFDNGATFIDVRSIHSWKRGRIPKSVHMDLLNNFSEGKLNSNAKKENAIVIYCNGPRCLRSSIASAKAIKWGYEEVYYFRDGFPAWERADYPVISVGNIVGADKQLDPRV